MGSGSKIKFGIDPRNWSIGFNTCRFPFDVTISVFVLCFWVSIGFGKGYDE